MQSLNNNLLQQMTPQVMARADELYARRADITNVSKSIEFLHKAEADCYEKGWRLGRALFFLGQEAPDTKLARIFHVQGVEAGRRAVKVQADRVEGHFWLGVNLALLAPLESPAKAVAHALRARRALSKAITIDASYHSAGPLRVLARLEHKLPRLVGGGLAKAGAKFERAIGIAPANTVTRIYFAEFLLETGEIDRARSELETVLNTPLDPDWAFEIDRDQRLAREMIKRFTAPLS